MLTSRGWWFLMIVSAVLALGVLSSLMSLTWLGLTLLLWFLSEWLLFVLRLRLAVPGLRFRRQLYDDRGPVDTLWAGKSVRVELEMAGAHWLGQPYLKITDYVPFGATRESGANEAEGILTPETPLSLSYRLRCPAPTRIRYEGLGIQLSDLQGLFYHAAFLPSLALYRVLPPLADIEGHRPTVKRHNLLPSPGLHRHLRPGSGSELLDLRDYLPGDPPKTIAWKVSARRDRLITKEFESEVPLRCTLFVDTSNSVRVGAPGRTALARLVDLSAAVAQAAAGARDLVGLCLFDDKHTSRYVRPARGARHIVGLLNLLAEAASQAPATGQARLRTLLPLAYSFAHRIYPHLLRPAVNRVPGWLPWLWPLPTYTDQPVRLSRRLFRWLFFAAAYLPLLLVVLFCVLFADVIALLADPLLPLPPGWLPVIGAALAVGVAVLYYPLVNQLYRCLGLFIRFKRHRLARWRKQMAAVVAERYNLGPGGLGLLLEDDAAMVGSLQRFLAEHQVPYPLPLFDRRGRYLFASPGKITVLAQALLRAVGKGHDNELFVLLVDGLELTDHLDPLLRAVKVTLARHHQVVVICPWPPGVPPPGTTRPTTGQGWALAQADLRLAVHQATIDRLHQAFARLRQAFARLGVPVVCAASGDPVQLILDRLAQMRQLGLGRRR
jgi:uncharacterized protein (DUF58 family)